MPKKTLTINEIFCGMPHLKDYFHNQERLIRKFGEGNGENPAVEALKQKEEILLKTARQMDIEDLRVVYYVHNIKKMKPYRIVEMLRKTNDAVEEILNLPKEVKEKIAEAKLQ